jgi:hypothetical protein
VVVVIFTDSEQEDEKTTQDRSVQEDESDSDQVEDSFSDTSEVKPAEVKPADYGMLNSAAATTNSMDTSQGVANGSSEDTSQGVGNRRSDDIVVIDEEDSDDDEFNEDEIMRDTVFKDIYITMVLKSETTKTGRKKKSDRCYNSIYPCPFNCQGLKSNFSHHVLARLHANEDEIKEINKHTGKEKKLLIDMLRYKACNDHNLKVLQRKKGIIFLGRRQSHGIFDVATFGPCPNCLKWIKLKVMKRHQPKCPGRQRYSSSDSRQTLILQSNVLSGRLCEHASTALKNEVFTILRPDEVGRIAQNDPLIVALGNKWMERNVGNKLMRKYYTSGVMRLAARLRLHLNNLKHLEEGPELENYLVPEHFDDVVKAALLCAAQDADDEEDLATPSNAIKLSYDLKRFASIKLALAIKQGDEVKRRQSKDFSHLMKISWTNKLARRRAEVGAVQ